MPMLFQKNHVDPLSEKEAFYIKHTKKSFEKALKLNSKLSGKVFEESLFSVHWRRRTLPKYHALCEITRIPMYHLLNNICELEGGSHLHVGLLAGDSFIAAMFQNENFLTWKGGIDWFRECPKSIFLKNCRSFCDMKSIHIYNSGCFVFNKQLISHPIDIFFYDADHSMMGQQKAITYYNDIFADICIIIIDDWDCPWVRRPTFKAFEKLHYGILYEDFIPKTSNGGDGGQYIAVIKK